MLCRSSFDRRAAPPCRKLSKALELGCTDRGNGHMEIRHIHRNAQLSSLWCKSMFCIGPMKDGRPKGRSLCSFFRSTSTRRSTDRTVTPDRYSPCPSSESICRGWCQYMWLLMADTRPAAVVVICSVVVAVKKRERAR